MSLLCSLVVLAALTGVSEEPGAAELVESAVVPPQVILSTQKAPIYPPAALAARFDGVVHVRVNVLADGAVGPLEVVTCDHPNLGFEQAAIEAIKRWRFEPAMRGDVPVEYETTLRLSFRTGPSGSDRQPYVSAGTVNNTSSAQVSTAQVTATGAKR